jgi:hypothetical protein
MNNNNKNSLIKNRSLFSETDNIQNQLVKNHQTNQRYCSFNNLTNLGNKFNKESPIKLQNKNKNKNLNIINFIKQKKRFFIENSFDNKGTIQFLASKEIAMRVIKLDDEIIDKNKNITNKNLQKMNFLDIDENTYYNLKNHRSSKAAGRRTISPRKSRNNNNKIISQKEILKIDHKKTKKSKKTRKSKKEENNKNSLILNSKKNNSKENFIIFDKASNDSHSNIYKFFIDNANEPEENFHKKLQKELKKVENLKKNNNSKPKRKSISRKDIEFKPKSLNSVIFQKNKDTQSVFMFSEKNKNLMKNDDINISSIGEKNNIDSPKNNSISKKEKRTYGSIQFNNKQIKEKIKKKITKDINNDEICKNVINSDKDSIISILSDLM